MAWNAKYILVHGELSDNKDFFLTKEYFEMIRLWNTLNKDESFDLPMEVMRDNKDAIRLWKLFTIANNIHISNSFKKNNIKKSKRGRKTPPDADKLKALQDWDEVDKSITNITLEQFLAQRFKELYVATSTFHGWRDQMRKKGYEI